MLILDLDPQGNASTGLGVPRGQRKVTSYDVLVNESPLVEAAVGDELASGRGLGRRRERLGVELPCQPVRLEQALALLGVAPRTAGLALLVAQLDAVLAGEPLHGLDEAEPLDLLHERDRVAALAAAEAVEGAARRVGVERRRLLVVEGAETLHGAPGPTQRDVLLDDLVDVVGGTQPGDEGHARQFPSSPRSERTRLAPARITR